MGAFLKAPRASFRWLASPDQRGGTGGGEAWAGKCFPTEAGGRAILLRGGKGVPGSLFGIRATLSGSGKLRGEIPLLFLVLCPRGSYLLCPGRNAGCTYEGAASLIPVYAFLPPKNFLGLLVFAPKKSSRSIF